MNTINIFQELKGSYKFKEAAEYYFQEELILIGTSTYTTESDTCPRCGHSGCFRVKADEETEDEIDFCKCFSCELYASDIPSLIVSLNPSLNNYQAAEMALSDAAKYGFARAEGESKRTLTLRSSVSVPKGVLEPSERRQAIFEEAAKYFVLCLSDSSEAQSYQIRVRKHSLETLRQLKVGFSHGQLYSYLKRKGFSFDEAVESGLVKSNGQDYLPAEVFIYAHLDEQGRVRHFTFKDPERRLQYQLPKAYQLWGEAFYGQQTLVHAPTSKKVYVVEGENDLISVIESGCNDAVLATIGQLSKDQCEALRRLGETHQIITLFDNDHAGDKYRERIASAGLSDLLQYILPDRGSDPDDYLKKGHSFEEMLQCSTLWVPEGLASSTLVGESPAPAPSKALKEADFSRTDIGNADLLAVFMEGRFRYVLEHKDWAWFDGRFWRFFQGHQLMSCVRMVSRQRGDWAAVLPNNTNEEKERRRKAMSFAFSCQNVSRINAMIKVSANNRDLLCSVSDFDDNPYLLGALNGIVDLRTGELLPHDPSLMISKHCNANYDPSASYSRWLSVLKRALDEGDATEAEEGVRYLWKVFGMALIGKVLERALFFFHGKPGTGKSLVTNTIRNVLSDYALVLSPNSLMQSSYNSNDIKMPEIVKLKGVRYALASEADDGQRFNEGLLKRITGSDELTARDLGEKAISFKPQCTLFIVGNSRPSASGSDAFWQRLKVISFNNQIPKGELDPHLDSTLMEEADGILTWLVRGCLAYQSEGLSEPRTVARDSAAYRADLDVLAQFIEDRCELSPDYQVHAQSLFDAYEEWAENVHRSGVLGRTRFYERLSESGFSRKKTRAEGSENGTCHFYGLRLKRGFPVNS